MKTQVKPKNVNIHTCVNEKELQSIALFDESNTRRFDAIIKLIEIGPSDVKESVRLFKQFLEHNKNIDFAHKVIEFISNEDVLNVITNNLANDKVVLATKYRLTDLAFVRRINQTNNYDKTVKYLNLFLMPNSLMEIINGNYHKTLKVLAVKSLAKIEKNHPEKNKLFTTEELYDLLCDIGTGDLDYEIRFEALIAIKDVRPQYVNAMFLNDSSKELREKLLPFVPEEYRKWMK